MDNTRKGVVEGGAVGEGKVFRHRQEVFVPKS